MMRYILILLLPSLCFAQTPRFSGAANLQSPQSNQSNARFELHADLHPARAKSMDARFDLNARFEPKNKLLAGSCTITDSIFENGFEN